jgi:hypothetical protein
MAAFQLRTTDPLVLATVGVHRHHLSKAFRQFCRSSPGEYRGTVGSSALRITIIVDAV